LLKIVAVWGILFELDDRNATAGLLPMSTIEFPRPKHRIIVARITGNEIHVEIGLEIC
jgi:hypothetical protein